MEPKLRGIPRTVILLGLVSFFNDFSSEMIYPLLPLFLTSVLGASTVAIGLIEGVAESTSAVLKVVSGVWTDRIQKRKSLVIAGYTLAGLARPVIGLAQTWPVVLGLRFTDRVGKGIRSAPRDALLADVTAIKRRGAAYGFHRAMDHAGAMVGPLAASLAMTAFGMPMRTVFILSIVPALLAIAILFFGVRESEKSEAVIKNEPFNLFGDWKHLNPQFKTLLVAHLIFTLGNATDAFLLVRLSDAGVPAGWIAALWSVHHLIKMVSNYYGGRISDRVGTKRMIASGWFFYAAIYLGFALFESMLPLVLTFFAYGIYYGFVEPAERSLVSVVAPKSKRGTAFGYYHFVTGLGSLPASIVFGWIWKTWSAEAAFLTGAGFAFIAVLLLMRMRADS
jgi:MFS family permease